MPHERSYKPVPLLSILISTLVDPNARFYRLRPFQDPLTVAPQHLPALVT
jgi:hypothetical protein